MNLTAAHDAKSEEHMARLVSNSEVSDFLLCQRKHYYAHLRKLKRKGQSDALTRGIVGHEALASYYEVLMDNSPGEPSQVHSASVLDRAEQAARATLHGYLSAGDSLVGQEIVYDLDRILKRYFEYAANDNWTILAVEKQYGIPINNDFEYTMRLDVLAVINGEPTLVDHKFKYNFFTQAELDMNAQVPKYIGTLKYNGIPVERGMMNQIRYRVSKDQSDENMFKRVYIKPHPVEIKNTLREQILVSEKIIDRRALTVEQQSEAALRVMSPMICKNCPFIDLCKAELQGGDITLAIRSEFEVNDYGYNDDTQEALF